MSDLDFYNIKGHRIITKWFQPYIILETAKKYFDVTEYTFNGLNKFDFMEKFLTEIKTSSNSIITIGLYMKNVNKFYVLKLKQEFIEKDDISALHNLLLKTEFEYTEQAQKEQDGIKYITDTDEAFNVIDLGKAEASFIMNI